MRILATMNTRNTVLAFLLMVLLVQINFITPLFAQDYSLGERLVKDQCSTCHKFKGKAETRFNLDGPDLMWGRK